MQVWASRRTADGRAYVWDKTERSLPHGISFFEWLHSRRTEERFFGIRTSYWVVLTEEEVRGISGSGSSIKRLKICTILQREVADPLSNLGVSVEPVNVNTPYTVGKKSETLIAIKVSGYGW